MAAGPTPLRHLALAWLLGLALLFSLKGSTLLDPHYWDALGCYVFQGRLFAQRLHYGDAGYYGFIRPPGFIGLMALAMRLLGDTVAVLHGVTLAVEALVAPALWLLVKRLGGGRRAFAFSLGLCLLCPHFFAQAGQAQSDLPAAVWMALAFALLLDGRPLGYALCGALSVLSKESATPALCFGAAWVLLREGPCPPGTPLLAALRRPGAAFRALLPSAVPGLTVIAWLCYHRHLTGVFLFRDHADIMGPGMLPLALYHNFLDGGRLVLWLAAAPLLLALRDPARRGLPVVPLRLLAALALAFPLLFPAALPRYMLPSLPLLAALSGVGLCRLGGRRAPLLFGAAALVLLLGLSGRYSLRDVAHLEMSLAYRDLVQRHRDAAASLAAARPRLVLSDFPLIIVLTAPPQDGYLRQPLPVRHVTGREPLAQLCEADHLVVGQGAAAEEVRRRLEAAGALTPLAVFDGPLHTSGQSLPAEEDSTVRTFRVRCPGQP